MGRCIVDALLTVDPWLGLAARWRRRPADDGAGRDVSSSCAVESTVELQTKVVADYAKFYNHRGVPY